MTAFTTVLDRADYGSSVDGRRLFIVILDLQPDVGKKFERRFHSILEELRLPDRVPVHRSLLNEGSPQLSSQAREAMAVTRDLPKWKDVHEAAFLGLSLTWPPRPLSITSAVCAISGSARRRSFGPPTASSRARPTKTASPRSTGASMRT